MHRPVDCTACLLEKKKSSFDEQKHNFGFESWSLGGDCQCILNDLLS